MTFPSCCFCAPRLYGGTQRVRARTIPTCSATGSKESSRAVSRRAALAGLGALALGFLATRKDAANAAIESETLEPPTVVGPFGMKPNGRPHTPEEVEIGEEEAGHFNPDWEVGSERSYQQGLSIFGQRLFFVLSTAAFTQYGRIVSDRESGRVRLPEVYDPKGVAGYFAIRPDKVLSRAVQWIAEALSLALLAVRHAADARISDENLTPKDLERMQSERREQRAEAMREAVARLGPAFMKLAQAVSMRPDLVGPEIARALQSLTDEIVAPFPSIEAFELLRNELGASPQYVFDGIDMTPFAGASLGMVYRGVVDGERVAVKIQRPGVSEMVALDFYLLRALIGFGTWALGYRGQLRGFLDEYAAEVFEELDYRKEARNMKKFRDMYKDTPGVYIPRAYPKYTSQKVLVTEYVDGNRILNEQCEVAPSDVGLVRTGISFALTQLLDKGFLHGDMHNGNMLATPDGKVAYIDFGMVVNIPQRARQAMVLALFYLIHGEYRLLAEQFVDLGLMEPADLDEAAYEITSSLTNSFAEMTGPADVFCDPESPVVCRFTMIGVAEKFLQLGGRFPLAYDSYFINSLRCIALLEGLALRADPNFQVLNIIYPIVMRKVLAGAPRAVYKEALDSVLQKPSGAYEWDKLDGMLQEVRLAEADNKALPTTQRADDDRSLDELLLSRQGRYIRGQLVRELALPNSDGSAAKMLSGKVFKRASTKDKFKAIATIFPILILRLLFIVFMRMMSNFRRRPNKPKTDDPALA